MFSANTSTASLVTVSSRAPLTRSAPTKDFQAAFASLQSTYGFAASAPTPVQKKNSSSTRSPSATTSTPAVHRSTSTSASQTKDFESAFANLQSTYGFAGSAPMPVSTPATFTNLFSKRSSSPSAAK
ncbi:hypothetical protein C8R46DRAFT_119500 [Mycena filopes]|nr:hypothetical protein C8R46DRAFT_119500 [Mycena filopes]